MFKSKGAVIALVWSFCGCSLFQSLYTTHFNWSHVDWQVSNTVTITRLEIVTPCFFLYPIFGWLADTKFGRYLVIKWSFVVLLVLSCLFCLLSVFQLFFSSNIINKLLLLWHVLMAIASGGVIANIIQFSMDQLYDASSSEIVSFLRWWSWVWSLSGITTALGRSCFCNHPTLANLYLPSITTLAIIFDILFSSQLIKELPPIMSSPLVNIYKVLRYAARHKYPRRSAPTDWDERYSARLDVGKSKYGGPFTTEEVEDVKTFLRISAVSLVVCFFFGLFVPTILVYHAIIAHLDNPSVELSCGNTHNCFKRIAMMYSGDIIAFVFIPLLEFIVCPSFRLRLSASILKRSFFAMFLAIVSLFSVTSIVLVAQLKGDHSVHNETCTVGTDVEQSIDYRWMAIPYALETTLQLIMITSGAEFITAQSPYALKSFIFGMTYGFFGLFSIFGISFSISIRAITKKWLFNPYGCTFWYLVLELSACLVVIIITAVSFNYYRRRQQEDMHEQMFRIDYYS